MRTLPHGRVEDAPASFLLTLLLPQHLLRHSPPRGPPRLLQGLRNLPHGNHPRTCALHGLPRDHQEQRRHRLPPANAAAGVTSAMAAQLVWTPIDVVSQRLMVQGSGGSKTTVLANLNSENYRSGFDAFRKIMCADGARGFYRGFGISILTYAPSNAVWWTSYSMVHRLIWGAFGSYMGNNNGRKGNEKNDSNKYSRSDSKAMVAVQGLSVVMASGVSAIVTMPFDTIKTRLQVLDLQEGNGRRRPLTFVQTVRNLVKEGGLLACYRGLGPRWASMSMSATTMITTYEFLKRMSTKNQEDLSPP
ncbi:Solute carrier family 25 member 44 [Glycine soja]|nr:Solute carrier family 25 member 44 [Glycine soja]